MRMTKFPFWKESATAIKEGRGGAHSQYHSTMEVTYAWQWRPKAALTAADSCAACSVLALQYADCSVLRVRRTGRSWCASSGSSEEPQVEEGTGESDIELHGHTDRVTSVRAYFDPSRRSADVTIASASRDW